MTNPWLDVGLFALRTLGVGLLIYVLGRYLPRRSGGGLAAYDFVFFWMMGGLAVAPLFDLRIRFIDTVAAVAAIYACHWALSGLAMKSARWARLVSGAPITLIEHGSIRKSGMERALLPLEILLSELRRAGAGRVSAVETAVMETTGHVSIVKKTEHVPVTAGDVHKGGTDQPLPLVVVADGKVVRHNLDKLGVAEAWLNDKLEHAQAPQSGDIYAAVWEGSEPIYWAPKTGFPPPTWTPNIH
ncbi:MAG: DUF421 domain-containing protein [Symbiobacteriia bacterium]